MTFESEGLLIVAIYIWFAACWAMCLSDNSGIYPCTKFEWNLWQKDSHDKTIKNIESHLYLSLHMHV